ncbi:hypothetical protein V8F33_007191 [Rhypophila sp. PSN 637]
MSSSNIKIEQDPLEDEKRQLLPAAIIYTESDMEESDMGEPKVKRNNTPGTPTAVSHRKADILRALEANIMDYSAPPTQAIRLAGERALGQLDLHMYYSNEPQDTIYGYWWKPNPSTPAMSTKYLDTDSREYHSIKVLESISEADRLFAKAGGAYKIHAEDWMKRAYATAFDALDSPSFTYQEHMQRYRDKTERYMAGRRLLQPQSDDDTTATGVSAKSSSSSKKITKPCRCILRSGLRCKCSTKGGKGHDNLKRKRVDEDGDEGNMICECKRQKTEK